MITNDGIKYINSSVSIVEKDLWEQAQELFNDELNWNNCDKTSGQYVETVEQIYERLNKNMQKKL